MKLDSPCALVVVGLSLLLVSVAIVVVILFVRRQEVRRPDADRVMVGSFL